MSEKVTFGELIESIADKTDNSKQFTHDFLKDFVDVINDGLEEDGKVNIAGFGKFELKRVDEREGYNPQSQEKITIPAHNKVVFKPYKNLRELVNAPYAHMEPQLIEDESSSDKEHSATDEHSEHSQDVEAATPERTEESELNKDDFIPTAPPTSHDHDGNDKSPELSDENDDNEDDNGDIVEFDAQQSDEDDDDILEKFIGSGEQEQQEDSSEHITEQDETEAKKNEIPESEETSADAPEIEKEDDSEKEPVTSEEKEATDEAKKLEQAGEELKQYQPNKTEKEDTKKTTSPAESTHSSSRSSSFLYVAAAAIILLLLAGGAWYYSTLQTNDTTLITSTEEPTATADMNNQQDDKNQQQSTEQQEAEGAQQAAQNQSQSAPTQASSSQPTNNAASNNEAVAIEKGQTLWSLAEERYGNPRLWPWIYGNNGSLDNPDLIYAGSSLSVPLPSGPQNTLNSADSVGVAKGFIATYKWYKSNEQPRAKNHLWAAKLYHDDLQQLADVPIDKTDLSYANRAR